MVEIAVSLRVTMVQNTSVADTTVLQGKYADN